jgi:hypothetical protein
MFNLDQAIAEWRRQMRTAGIKSSRALEELESHLREEIQGQMQSGMDAPSAFREGRRLHGRGTSAQRGIFESRRGDVRPATENQSGRLRLRLNPIRSGRYLISVRLRA